MINTQICCNQEKSVSLEDEFGSGTIFKCSKSFNANTDTYLATGDTLDIYELNKNVLPNGMRLTKCYIESLSNQAQIPIGGNSGLDELELGVNDFIIYSNLTTTEIVLCVRSISTSTICAVLYLLRKKFLTFSSSIIHLAACLLSLVSQREIQLRLISYLSALGFTFCPIIIYFPSFVLLQLLV